MDSEVSRNLGLFKISRAPASLWPVVQSWVRDHLFIMVVTAVGLGVVILHLVGLTSFPPGFYVDEASIGYNDYAVTDTPIYDQLCVELLNGDVPVSDDNAAPSARSLRRAISQRSRIR